MKSSICFLLSAFLLTAVCAQLSRTNYASAFLGAKLLDHHKEAKGAHNVLVDDNEKYMIVPCRADRKFFIVQLLREIEVDTISISNREYFSSSVRNFSLVGSNAFPCTAPCMWRVLGHFQANFSKVTQSFPLRSPHAVRYIKFLWATSHGTHQSCTLTHFQVFGSDALDSFVEEIQPASDSFGSEIGMYKTNTSSTVCQFWERPDEICPLLPLKISNQGFAAHRFAKQLQDTRRQVSLVNQSFTEFVERSKLASRLHAQQSTECAHQMDNLSHVVSRLSHSLDMLEQEVSLQRLILIVCFLCAVVGIVSGG